MSRARTRPVWREKRSHPQWWSTQIDYTRLVVTRKDEGFCFSYYEKLSRLQGSNIGWWATLAAAQAAAEHYARTGEIPTPGGTDHA